MAQPSLASRLAASSTANGRQATTVLHVAINYEAKAQIAYLRDKGETLATIGDHAGIIDTSELLDAHPQGVDLARLTPCRYAGTTGHFRQSNALVGRYGLP